MSTDTQLYLGLGYCALLVLLAWIFYKKQPKSINSLYGYRTPRSMKNQQTWEAANTYSSVFMLRLCYGAFSLPFIGYLAYPQQNLFVTLMVHSGLLIGVIIFTERHLKSRFDTSGNPK